MFAQGHMLGAPFNQKGFYCGVYWVRSLCVQASVIVCTVFTMTGTHEAAHYLLDNYCCDVGTVQLFDWVTGRGQHNTPGFHSLNSLLLFFFFASASRFTYPLNVMPCLCSISNCVGFIWIDHVLFLKYATREHSFTINSLLHLATLVPCTLSPQTWMCIRSLISGGTAGRRTSADGLFGAYGRKLERHNW